MSKHIQLEVPKPCHENWDKMTPVEKGRFCNSCQKQVVDFTSMSDSQVAAFFRKPSAGSVCGRFMPDQLNRDLEIPKKRVPWVRYFFQFALPAFLMSAKAVAQGNAKVLTGDTVIAPVKGKPAISPVCKPDMTAAEKTIKGKITDIKGTGVPYTSVYIKGTNIGVAADSQGNFQLKYKGEENKIVLVSSCVGFMSMEVEINMNQLKDIKVILQPEENRLSGEVVVIAGMIVRAKVVPKKKESIPLINRVLKDTVSNKFRIFPNPVIEGTSLNIEVKEKIKEGYYKMELINQSGQPVYTREIWIDKEAKLLNIEIPSIKAGSYFLTLTNGKSNKRFAEKIIIQ